MPDWSNISGFISPLMRVVMYGVAIVLIVVVAYIIMWYNKFKYICLIYEKRAEGKSAFAMDKGAFMKLRGGDWIFKLFKRRHTIKPPQNKFLWPVGKRTAVHFRHLGSDLYEPFNPDFPDTEEDEFLMNLNYDETLSWNINIKDRLKTVLDFKNLWEKYGLLIISLIALVMTIVVIYLLLGFTQEVMAQGAGAVREQGHIIADTLKNAIAGGDVPN